MFCLHFLSLMAFKVVLGALVGGRESELNTPGS